jgi:hypothetical protein
MMIPGYGPRRNRSASVSFDFYDYFIRDVKWLLTNLIQLKHEMLLRTIKTGLIYLLFGSSPIKEYMAGYFSISAVIILMPNNRF